MKDADRDKEGLKLKLEGEAHMKANLGALIKIVIFTTSNLPDCVLLKAYGMDT